MRSILLSGFLLFIFYCCSVPSGSDSSNCFYENALLNNLWKVVLEDEYLKVGIPVTIGYSSIYGNPKSSNPIKSFTLYIDTNCLSVESKVLSNHKDLGTLDVFDTIHYPSESPESTEEDLRPCKFDKNSWSHTFQGDFSFNSTSSNGSRDSVVNIRFAIPICSNDRIFQTVYFHNSDKKKGDLLELFMTMNKNGELLDYSFHTCHSCIAYL